MDKTGGGIPKLWNLTEMEEKIVQITNMWRKGCHNRREQLYRHLRIHPKKRRGYGTVKIYHQ